MAKQKPEEVAEMATQVQEEENARKPQEVKVNTGTKNVRIQIAEEVDCIIAGVPYKLNKDKAYQVPSDVAAILCNAKKAYRL